MARVATLSAVVAGSASLLWLSNAPSPKGSAVWIADLYIQWLKSTGTFDRVLSGVELQDLDKKDGTLRGTLLVTGPLCASDGFLHEGAVMLLIDDLSTVGIMSAGCFPGVSVELGASINSRVRDGEKLSFEARKLKSGRNLAFCSVELRRVSVNESEGPGELVASGTHTKFVAAPFLVRVLWALLLRLPALAKLLARRWLAKLVQNAKNLPAMPKSMGEVLTLQKSQQQGDFTFEISPSARNPGGVMHGAAIAGILADAVRAHVSESCIAIEELSISYISPVPKGLQTISVIPLPSTRSGCTSIAEIRDRRGRILVRGRFGATQGCVRAA